jgi:kynureninase
MNTLTVNLHLMMVSFYRPSQERHKILMEGGAFPSDAYAAASQARFHGYEPKEAVRTLQPRAGEDLLREEDILDAIERQGPSLALLLLGNVNYLTGQAFDIPKLTRAAHAQGAMVGFDLAHGAGNLLLNLHEEGPDFAVWCSYKYLNGGPGSLAGCFVHERHARSKSMPRFEGWWGHDKATRFQMGPSFDPIDGAEGWQLSNPPILQLAALRASLELFDEATMAALRAKSERLTGYLEFLLARLPEGVCRVVTPKDPTQRGAQLSLRLQGEPRRLLAKLTEEGVVCDFREPDIIRASPAPLYCGFEDVYRFAQVLQGNVRGS